METRSTVARCRVRWISAACVLICSLLSAPAASNDLASANAAGFVRRTVPGLGVYRQFGLNLNCLSGSNTLADILGTNQLRAAANYAEADRVMLWDVERQAYQAFATWDVDYRWYPCNSAEEWNTAPPSNPPIAFGSAFWVVTGSGLTNPLTFTVTGELLADPVFTNVLVPGQQMVTYPYFRSMNIQDLSLAACGALAAEYYTSADQLIYYAVSNYRSYALKDTDRMWHDASSLAAWLEPPVSNVLFESGQGFWYNNRSSNLLQWVEARPCLNGFLDAASVIRLTGVEESSTGMAITVAFPAGAFSNRLDFFFCDDLSQEQWCLGATLPAGASGNLTWLDTSAADTAVVQRAYVAANADLDEWSDADGDGLAFGRERLLFGTDPHVADSDLDGFGDGVEAIHGSDPMNVLSLPAPGRLYVDAYTGNDSNDGLTPAWDGRHGPFARISKGLAMSVSGDCIVVTAGVYRAEGGTLSVGGKTVRLVPQGTVIVR